MLSLKVLLHPGMAVVDLEADLCCCHLLQLIEMPVSCMFVGRTQLSMRDIRNFNSLQNHLYLLHKSDCR